MQASILLFHGSTLDAVMRIETTAPGFTSLLFSQDGSQLLATTADRHLLSYAVNTGTSPADGPLLTYMVSNSTYTVAGDLDSGPQNLLSCLVYLDCLALVDLSIFCLMDCTLHTLPAARNCMSSIINIVMTYLMS